VVILVDVINNFRTGELT